VKLNLPMDDNNSKRSTSSVFSKNEFNFGRVLRLIQQKAKFFSKPEKDKKTLAALSFNTVTEKTFVVENFQRLALTIFVFNCSFSSPKTPLDSFFQRNPY